VGMVVAVFGRQCDAFSPLIIVGDEIHYKRRKNYEKFFPMIIFGDEIHCKRK
jgi:hypothetical protein